jgi:hypothetical protein
VAISILRATGELQLSAFWKDGTTGAILSKTFGALGVPELDVSLTFGTTSGKANWAYYASRTVATVTADNLDLNGSLVDGLGNTISATKLKLLVLAINAPNGTKALRFGPQGVANAAQFNFGGVSGTDYQTVTHWHLLYEPVAGYTVVGGSSDVIGIYNPSAESVTYSILMMGV